MLSRAEVAQLLDVRSLISALAQGFVRLSSGEVSVPPRVAADAPGGFLGVMPGWTRDIALAAKLVSVFRENHAVGLPSHQALIAMFDEVTGAPVAVMDGTEITAVRTAASAALAVRELARADARVLVIVGAGVQGAAHLRAVPLVRAFAEVRVASRSFAHASVLASSVAGVVAVESIEDAVRGADVVCCCTDAPSPVVQRSWLREGAHVSSVGASRVGPELDAQTIADASVFVESRVACSAPPAGAWELVGASASSVTELGEVLAGLRPGRRSDAELTVWKSMGHAVEDAVAARLVLDAARRLGVGREVDLSG
ncbi:MAG TPA: ornithine cyclodeaminase family protein [Candidatus Dormibacteraeota bacterium]|jgi:ornithine cyclodeaminase/alanine dehydrogenase-like protein (mu-crystallin family)|nr:ornithine cyclodeaminase family protein [Candidatus Dormibacteraeota bacterium]